MALVHGGDIQGFIDEYGYEPLDFSANVSPLGLPEAVVEAIGDCVSTLAAYPDPLCRKLVASLAAHHEVDASQVLCGNGCSDLIFRLAAVKKPRRALMCAPTFSEYAAALELQGCQIDRYQLDEDSHYQLDEGILEQMDEGVKMVFICQPNNPTGLTTSRELVIKILQRCSEIGALLVVDECFIEFIDDPDAITSEGLLAQNGNLVILKAFTKLYGMAGLRLGYLLCSDAELVESLRLAAQPWAVSTVAQAAGVAALASEGYVDELRALIKQERTFLAGALAEMGISAQGEANFLFFSLDDGGAFAASMRAQGVLVRDCSNYPGLELGSYRIAVRSHDENVQLLSAIENALKGA